MVGCLKFRRRICGAERNAVAAAGEECADIRVQAALHEGSHTARCRTRRFRHAIAAREPCSLTPTTAEVARY